MAGNSKIASFRSFIITIFSTRLRDLLTVPMQRVLKYHLILRQLMSNTATTHEEYHLIQQAYEAMLDVSDYINEVRSGCSS